MCEKIEPIITTCEIVCGEADPSSDYERGARDFAELILQTVKPTKICPE